jgi:phage N-6-adenine-methyltransferase
MDEVDDRATVPSQFAVWDRRFGGFTVDVAAAPHNAKCAKFYTREDDGLSLSWGGELVWCNPPYSDIAPWVAKAWDEYQNTRGIVMLLPANRTEQGWWQQMIEPHRDRDRSPLRVEFLPGRLRFLKRGQSEIGPNERPPFGCCLVLWGVR